MNSRLRTVLAGMLPVLVLGIAFPAEGATPANPGFELTPDLVGWTVTSGALPGSAGINRSGGATEGTAFAVVSASGSTGACASAMGPALRSSTFGLAAGQTVSVDWRGIAGSDASAVRATLWDVGGTVVSVFLNYLGSFGGDTGWLTASTAAPAGGSYFLVLEGGSWDATCGGVVGATTYFDNVRLSVGDFGDAPATYGTLASGNGSWHLVAGPVLGAQVTSETDALSPLDGTGDTGDDGVAFLTPLVAGQNATIQVTVSNAASGAKLDAFVDWDRNGVFDAAERITASGGTTVANGVNSLVVLVPASAGVGVSTGTFARFRISTAGGLGPNGAATDGEVEDYPVTLSPVPEPTVQASAVSVVCLAGSGTSLRVSWVNGNGSGRIVLVRAGGTVPADPVDGTSYTANPVFGLGSEVGTGSFVVFDGAGSSVDVTGLAGGITYRVAVYEYNGSGGARNYLTLSPATGSGVPGLATHLAVGAPASATAGSPFSTTVTALDACGNVATAYSGTVHFTSSDGQAVLPADATLTNGVGTFPVTLRTIGTRTITATDTVAGTVTGTSSDVVVAAGAVTRFVVAAPANATAWLPFSFTVTALDALGNTATGYAGTIRFTSSDGRAALPPNATLTAGVGTFSAALATPGTQTITATDTVSSGVTATSNGIGLAEQSIPTLSTLSLALLAAVLALSALSRLR